MRKTVKIDYWLFFMLASQGPLIGWVSETIYEVGNHSFMGFTVAIVWSGAWVIAGVRNLSKE